MFYLIGLGNPGAQYHNNRHNAGHLFIEYLLKRLEEDKKSPLKNNGVAKKTDGYMNQSGSYVKKVVNSTRIDLAQLYIVHDDLDIPLGKFKIQFGTGPKLHNGIRSIEDHLSTNEFWRVRIGVDNRSPEQHIDGETYSLEDFRKEEEQLLQSTFEAIYIQLGRLGK